MSLLLVRHAHAGSRDRWSGSDAERPLGARGRDQASALTDALAGRPITRVLSSPALRCRQTVGPLATLLGLDVEVTPLLAEGAPAGPVRTWLDELAAAGDGDVVLCSHGDLLPDLLDRLADDGVPLSGHACAKGSVWALDTAGGRVVSGTYHREPGTLR